MEYAAVLAANGVMQIRAFDLAYRAGTWDVYYWAVQAQQESYAYLQAVWATLMQAWDALKQQPPSKQ